MEEATWNLLDKGEKIAQEATVLKEELTGALEEVRKDLLPTTHHQKQRKRKWQGEEPHFHPSPLLPTRKKLERVICTTESSLWGFI